MGKLVERVGWWVGAGFIDVDGAIIAAFDEDVGEDVACKLILWSQKETSIEEQ